MFKNVTKTILEKFHIANQNKKQENSDNNRGKYGQFLNIPA